MIEFKQIIGRGTRVYEGKDFFTIYDFVKAYHNFKDVGWEGPPKDCDVCGNSPCICDQTLCEECEFFPCKCPKVCSDCDNDPCVCEKPNCPDCGTTPCICEPIPCGDCENSPCTCGEKVVIKLSDGKTREIKHISSVMYWSPDGKPITAKEFVERMFDDLPQFFENEDQLREIWSNPTTREKLLEDLSEAGYDQEKLEGMKDLIDAKHSDVYDVLAYVAYAAEIHTRTERVTAAKPAIADAFSDCKQREFIGFILDKYIEDGVRELAPSKIKTLVALKYNTVNDAAAELGSVATVKETFVGFQKYLYGSI
jgi:type I restriction enzyme R subunit